MFVTLDTDCWGIARGLFITNGSKSVICRKAGLNRCDLSKAFDQDLESKMKIRTRCPGAIPPRRKFLKAKYAPINGESVQSNDGFL